MSFLLLRAGGNGRRAKFRALTAALVAGAGLAAWFGLAADRAYAAYSAQVTGGTLTITGDGASDQLALRLQAGSPTTLEVDVGNDGSADFSFDRGTFDAILVKAGGGRDLVKIDDTKGAFTDTETTTINGEGGNDTLLGGNGAETFLGGLGDDSVDGNRGNDSAFLGAGKDSFTWDPGDGSDLVEGDASRDDVLVFNGSGGPENFDFSANGPRLRFFRDVGPIVMDVAGVERVDLNGLGGPDATVVNDLAGTGVEQALVDLEGVLGGGAGDGQPDVAVVNGTAAADEVDVRSSAADVVVSGLAAEVRILRAEPANDRLTVNGLGGEDTITSGVGLAGLATLNVDAGDDADRVIYEGSNVADVIDVAASAGHVVVTGGAASPVDVTAAERLVVRGLKGTDTIAAGTGLAALTQLELDGGDDRDQIDGGDGADLLLGGGDADDIDGNRGNDVAFLGPGKDAFTWDPGDGSDVVEGEAGNRDVLVFNGSGQSENFDASANGPRLRFFRDVGTIVMDVAGVERVDLNALGGSDTTVVNDLTGTEVSLVDVDLAGVLGGGAGDGQADSVVVNGTAGDDEVSVDASSGAVIVSGLAAEVRVFNAEAANDRLTVRTLGGDDRVEGDTGLAALLALTADGGPDDDTLIGGDGADTLIGGPGTDTLDGGPGADQISCGGPGDTIVTDPADTIAADCL
jgi:Ca2+-binding RTX toxin-like protein